MPLIADTSVLITIERQRKDLRDSLRSMTLDRADMDVALSAISVVELTHGIYRAKTDFDRRRRSAFLEEVLRELTVYSLTSEIAHLAGRIEGEQAAVGNVLDFEDLLIGATAIYLGLEVMTLNRRHFESIPGVRLYPVPAELS